MGHIFPYFTDGVVFGYPGRWRLALDETVGDAWPVALFQVQQPGHRQGQARAADEDQPGDRLKPPSCLRSPPFSSNPPPAYPQTQVWHQKSHSQGCNPVMGQRQAGKHDDCQHQPPPIPAPLLDRLQRKPQRHRQNDLSGQLGIAPPVDVGHGHGRQQAGNQHGQDAGPPVPAVLADLSSAQPHGQGVERQGSQAVQKLADQDHRSGRWVAGQPAGGPLEQGHIAVKAKVVSEGSQWRIGFPRLEQPAVVQHELGDHSVLVRVTPEADVDTAHHPQPHAEHQRRHGQQGQQRQIEPGQLPDRHCPPPGPPHRPPPPKNDNRTHRQSGQHHPCSNPEPYQIEEQQPDRHQGQRHTHRQNQPGCSIGPALCQALRRQEQAEQRPARQQKDQRCDQGRRSRAPGDLAHQPAALSKTSTRRAAVRSQRNSAARARPRARRSRRSARSNRTRARPSASASTSVGSTVTAASPTASGREVVLAVKTGVPQAIASNGGRPNPS